MKSNQLVLNLTKTKSLFFRTAQKLAGATDFKILIQGKEIGRISKLCYLGVTLDENLSWKEHVGEVFNKVNKRLGLLGRIRSCLTIQAAKCIYNCLILPVLSSLTLHGASSLLSVATGCCDYKTEQLVLPSDPTDPTMP